MPFKLTLGTTFKELLDCMLLPGFDGHLCFECFDKCGRVARLHVKRLNGDENYHSAEKLRKHNIDIGDYVLIAWDRNDIVALWMVPLTSSLTVTPDKDGIFVIDVVDNYRTLLLEKVRIWLVNKVIPAE